MAYKVKGKNGIPIKKDGNFIMGFDIAECKIEQLDEATKSFIAIASTEDEDRDKDIIRLSGWDWKNFKKNPVIPWSHDYWEPPIGKAISIKKDAEKKRLIFKPQFDYNDEYAMKIFNKYKNGFLTSFSVGFIGLEFNWRDEDNKWYGGREFTKQELLEISAVTVPANPHATTDLRSMDHKPNLLNLGYKQYFGKTDKGIFYPIIDLELFTEPIENEVQKGIIAVCATPLSNPESKNKPAVGYFFDSDIYDENKANEWIKQNAHSKNKVSYYVMKDSEQFELDLVEEEEDVKIFGQEDQEEITLEEENQNDLPNQDDKSNDIDNPVEIPIVENVELDEKDITEEGETKEVEVTKEVEDELEIDELIPTEEKESKEITINIKFNDGKIQEWIDKLKEIRDLVSDIDSSVKSLDLTNDSDITILDVTSDNDDTLFELEEPLSPGDGKANNEEIIEIELDDVKNLELDPKFIADAIRSTIIELFNDTE
jgi:uncharacterized protein